MKKNNLPIHLNYIDGNFVQSKSDSLIEKFNPDTGKCISYITRSTKEDVDNAVVASLNASISWGLLSPVKRGEIVKDFAEEMQKKIKTLAKVVALETGKPPADAIGEVKGSIMQASFWAGEGMRLYGRSMTSGMDGKLSFTTRKPHGVVGLIVPANTPIANIAWKIFPALVCGNAIILKGSELAPGTAEEIAKIASLVGIPNGVFNLIQGDAEAGSAIVSNDKVAMISFTGSTAVGKEISVEAGKNLKRVSLELGGKNCICIDDDADLEKAVNWTILSAFSNAGQRCAAASRVLVCDAIYEKFVNELVLKTNMLKIGVSEKCDLGPLITNNQHVRATSLLKNALKESGSIIVGEKDFKNKMPSSGYYFPPTIVEGLSEKSILHTEEAFAPILSITKVKNIKESIHIINSSQYGLTSAIHSKNIDKVLYFIRRVNVGVVNVNLGTYGSEPHMPFGGFRDSGNGTREPGTEAIDIYSEVTNVSFLDRLE